MSKTTTTAPLLTAEETSALDAIRALYQPGGKRYMTASHEAVKAHGFVADRVLTHLLNGGGVGTVKGMGVGGGAHDVVKITGGAGAVKAAKAGATKAQMAKVLAHEPRGWDAERTAILALALKARGVKACGLTRALGDRLKALSA